MAEPSKKLEIVTLEVRPEEETKLRYLAMEIAKGIEEPKDILAKLKWSEEDYQEIIGTRVFKDMLAQYTGEWQSASNTKKRVELKSAVNIEAALPDFYAAMINPNEPLMARVKTLEVLGKIARLGGGEPVQGGGVGGGQHFKLEIHMDRGPPTIIEMGGGIPVESPEFTLESSEFENFVVGEPVNVIVEQSSLLADQEWEDL